MKFCRAAPVHTIPSGQGTHDGGPGSVDAAGLTGVSVIIAMRMADLVSPAGRPLAGGDRSALVVAGTPRIRTGDQLVFVKVVAVAPAVVRRDGRVQAGGHLAGHARLGRWSSRLDELAGPRVIESGRKSTATCSPTTRSAP